MDEIIKETQEHIGAIGKKVLWIGSRDGMFAISEQEFNELPPCEYDGGYGSQEIATDLVIVFKDGSFSDRTEYDGAEGWSHNETPIKTENPKKFNRMKGSLWLSLKEIQEGENDENC